MVESIKEAMERAMKKSTPVKSKGGKGGLIHPTFPPQGAMQPAFMGSQSAPPGGGGGGGIPIPGDPSQIPGGPGDMGGF